jgi:mannitol-1-phosphate 5-dehydrogenase
MAHANNPDKTRAANEKGASDGGRTFVGFGFGAIQAGLFVCEALRSGNFSRIVIAEVVPGVVDAVRRQDGHFGLNVAHHDRLESVTLGPVELENPTVTSDRERLVDAISEASEIATAVPSVGFYRSADESSIHRLLAVGLRRRRGKPCLIYTAENNQRAAEILKEAVFEEVPEEERDEVGRSTCFVNTVIGKMSAVIVDTQRIHEQQLQPVTPSDPRAFLVESFNHILTSAIEFPAEASFEPGFDAFEEKESLHPFEDAKLFGHNAIHALAAYLAAGLGLERIEELRQVQGSVEFLRQTFLEEAGKALVLRWRGADELFTPERFHAYVDDLLKRMVNPLLGDVVERVARDPRRKLAWEDRLVGSMRLGLREGLRPWRLGLGAAAALVYLDPGVLDNSSQAGGILEEIWRPSCPDSAEAGRVLALVEEGLSRLASSRDAESGLFVKRES